MRIHSSGRVHSHTRCFKHTDGYHAYEVKGFLMNILVDYIEEITRNRVTTFSKGQHKAIDPGDV